MKEESRVVALIHQEESNTIHASRISEASELISSFLNGKTKNTVEAYKRDLRFFAEFFGMSDASEAIGFFLTLDAPKANKAVLDYRSYMKEEKCLSASTINRRLSSVRALIKLARILGYVSYQIEIENVRSQAYRDTKGPEVYALRRMFSELGNTEKDIRDRAILRLLFDLALRRQEVSSIDFSDLDKERRLIWVKRKGKSEKVMLSLPDVTLSALLDWIAIRGTKGGPMFYSLGGGKRDSRISGRSIDRNIVKPLGEKLGIDVSPHKIRHTAITEAVKAATANGIGIEEVMDFSGHSDVKTIMIYRDRERNVQGKLSDLISKGVD